ncbi:MAG: hypothetical protein CMH53_05355 [Myxococcales bacterium]|nr:hypothetical protein [Myxococcales bacterium]
MPKANIDYLIDAKRNAGSTVTHMRFGKTGKAARVTFKRGTKHIVMVDGTNAKNAHGRNPWVLVGGKWKPGDAKLASKAKRTATWAAKR